MQTLAKEDGWSRIYSAQQGGVRCVPPKVHNTLFKWKESQPLEGWIDLVIFTLQSNIIEPLQWIIEGLFLETTWKI